MTNRSTPALLAVCTFALGAVAGAADRECDVVNLMPPFWAAIDEPDAAARLRVSVMGPHPDLYNESYVALPLGERWANEVTRERTYVSANRAAIESVEAYLSGNVPRFMRDFGRQFPDYRCDYTFYIAPSYGRMV